MKDLALVAAGRVPGGGVQETGREVWDAGEEGSLRSHHRSKGTGSSTQGESRTSAHCGWQRGWSLGSRILKQDALQRDRSMEGSRQAGVGEGEEGYVRARGRRVSHTIKL